MTTCSDESVEGEINAAGLNVQVWHAAHDGVLVVQIDEEEHQERIRVNLNDAPIWDGNSEVDARPGSNIGVMPFDVIGAARLLPDISEEQAAHVLSFFGSGGYPAGSHIQHVLNAIATADPNHFRMLSTVYPEYCAAMVLARQSEGGVGRLQSVVKGG